MLEAKTHPNCHCPEQKTTRINSVCLVNPERWVKDYGGELFGFAVLRVRDRSTAQDLVQETFLAGIKAKESFAARSNERAWLFGILRHKLVDFYRLKGRELPLANLETPLPEEQNAFGSAGVGKDGWLKGLAPKAWETPEGILVTKEFQEVLRSCLSRLPLKVAQAFVMREIDGVSCEEICKDLGESQNNVWVMLHRARMALRRCLEVRWFGNKRKDK